MQRSIIAPAERVTNLRWGIGLLLAAGMFLTAMTRAIPALAGNAAGAASVAEAFAWGLALARLPAGPLIDRFGAARVGIGVSGAWAVLVLASPFVLASGLFGTVRVSSGIAEGAWYPLAAVAIGAWFPRGERARAAALFDGAAKLGIGAGILGLAPLVAAYGWNAALGASGVLGLAYAAAFALFYRDRERDARLTHAERTYVANGGANADVTPIALGAIFGNPLVWGTMIALMSTAYAFGTVASATARQFGGTPLSAIPWLAAGAIEFAAGGILVDALIARGLPAARVRAGTLVAGLLLGLLVVAVGPQTDPALALALLTLALSGLGAAAAVGWSLPSLVTSAGAGTVAGVAGACAGVASIAAAGSGTGDALLTAVVAVGAIGSAVLLGRGETP